LNNPVALHLRAMNMLYEGLKQNSTIVVVPSSAIETMQLGGLAGLTALTMGLGDRKEQMRGENTIREASSQPVAAIDDAGVPATAGGLAPVPSVELASNGR
jgi:hypothetical protein